MTARTSPPTTADLPTGSVSESWYHRISQRCASAAFGFIVEPGADALRRWDLPDDLDGVARYVELVAAGLGDRAAMFKIQPAAFERFGADGWQALRTAAARLKASGAPVVLDCKRIDHGPILRSLLDTYVGPASRFELDGITVVPYFGIEEFAVLAEHAHNNKGFVLVIAQTSGPGSGLVQQARSRDRTVSGHVVDAVIRCNAARPAPALGLVLGGHPAGAGHAVSSGRGIFVLPGWGRPGCAYPEIAGIASSTDEPVIVTIGSRITHEPPHAQALRAFLDRQLAALADLSCHQPER